MDARELRTRCDALSKAISQNEPTTSIIGLLRTLKDSLAPNEATLRSTKAGVTVGKLRSHASPEVKQLASEIVGKWKRAVESEKVKKTRDVKLSSPASTPQAMASPAPPSSAGAVFKGDPEKRHFKTDGVDISRTGKESRDNCIGLMYNGLAFRSTEPIEKVLMRAMEVERAAFDAYKGESNEYKAKLRSLFQNLKNKTNANLGKRVMSGEIPADTFVKMDANELKSSELKKLEDGLQKENMKKAQVPMAEKSVSTALQCSKCKQKKVSYTQAQTRSADEPMTTFCECLNCGNRWKFS